MNIQQYDTTKLAWLAGIHGLFLVSLLAVALADMLGEPSGHAVQPEKKSRHGKR